MMSAAALDTNLLVLLIVGSASRAYISRHSRLDKHTEDDFDLLVELVGSFSDIIVLPHIWTEADYLVRSGGLRHPATQQVLDKMQMLITSTTEFSIPSAVGAARLEFNHSGLAGSVLLHLSAMEGHNIPVTLITADRGLANAAAAQGYAFIDYSSEFRHG